MNSFGYKLTAAALALMLASGCASGQKETLSSGDSPATLPTVNSEATFPETPPPAETDPVTEPTEPVTEPSSETEPASETSDDGLGYVLTERHMTMYSVDTVNIRESPDTESLIVGQFNPGDEVQVTGFTSHGWYRIDLEGNVAYVYAQYFSDMKPEITEEPIVLPEGYYFANADDYMFVVNKDNFLPEDYAIETDFVQGSYEMEIVAAQHCRQMIAAAAEDGIDLKVLSAYRTIDYQKKLFERNVNSRMEEDGMSYEEAYADTAINIAPPGGSEHNAGLAVDIIDRNHWDTYTAFEDTKEFEWLQKHCTEYGFILRYPKGKEDVTGYIYEPWHYRYVGARFAKEVADSGLCLEEYLG